MTPGPFRPGEPLRASDLSAVAAAASESRIPAAGFLSFQNGAETVVRNPRRNHSSKRNAAVRPRPFACRIAEDDGGNGVLLVYEPPRIAKDVTWDGVPLEPVDAVGTEEEPWISVGAWTGADRLWLLVTPPGLHDGEEYDGSWELALAPAAPAADRAGRTCFAHQVAAWEGERGLVQHHLGILALAEEWDGTQDEEERPPPCGHPLNKQDPIDDDHPLDHATGGGGGPINNSQTGNPLDGEGDGGYTPLCREDLERGEETQEGD